MEPAKPTRTLALGADALVVVGLVGLLFALVDVGEEWARRSVDAVEIDLSPLALPQYVLFSLSRGLIAYLLSLAFSLVYGYWAARDRRAERVLLPLLDVLQSIPVLGFLPGLVLALVALFPSRAVGLELAAVLMIFTAQAWNMTFSFYQSLKGIPRDLTEAGAVYRFSAWQRFREIELPSGTTGLVWNSMMSMAGGWFFLMVNEAFQLGSRDFRLPGIGSYMSVAVAQGNVPAMLWAIAAMVAMIVALDQLVWRPAVVWSRRFRIEEGSAADATGSWFLDWLRRSELLRRLVRSRAATKERTRRRLRIPEIPPAVRTALLVSVYALLAGAFLVGAWKLARLVSVVDLDEWLALVILGGRTLGRVLLATTLGTLWALPAGLAIGLSPRLSRLLQPVVQVAASFPAPMFFPLVIAALTAAGISLDWGSIALMLLGTQWYLLFNVIAGAMAIPSDLREAARTYRFGRWQRFREVYAPAVFPSLVTGWVTATGGAWNASIIAEYVSSGGRTLTARGLGARISEAAEHAEYPTLAASVIVMSAIVVLFNGLVWHRCYRLAATRYSLST